MMSENEAVNELTTSTIQGHLYSKKGAILNGAKVSCNDRETLSLADGFYSFKDLPPGRYDVQVDLKGYQSSTQTVSARENEVVVLDFNLSEALGSAIISGWVYDRETGKPIESGGTIILIQPISNRYEPIDEKGHYAIDKLPAGTYNLSTSIPEFDDTDALLTLEDGESVVHDFYCNLNRDVEPAWG
jgi:hypothetical protein